MSSSSSPSSHVFREYDVFLSFRGQDTRKTIVSHLYKALDNKGINTFKDDEKLERGDSISEKIKAAIEHSSYAIVVISENYASSRWCLDELQLIMERHRDKGLIVIPIFHGVDPSHVRHQTGSFAEALERYNTRPMPADKVPSWREALTQIAGLSGSDSKDRVDEATMIEEIVRGISRQLFSAGLTDFSDRVGMDGHMERLDTLMNIASKTEVRLIGIWGMGGIGKTTIAHCLYQRFSCRFRLHYFAEQVKDSFNKRGFGKLRAELFSGILGKQLGKFWGREVATNEALLRNRKVFVVLDDVDDVSQLHALARDINWFGPGSRIIITTRDKGLLNSYGRVSVYEVKCLDAGDALKMFKQIAFEGRSPPPSDDYETLSIRASTLAQGLPLAIEAFGLHLRKKNSPAEWNDALVSLERAPYQTVMRILRTSYEVLDQRDKIIFQYVASIFSGDLVRRVTALLDCGESRIEGLEEKCLIDLSSDGYINMHLLVQQTGREIVIEESGYRSWKQRMLWDPQTICDVLKLHTVKDRIEGVALQICQLHDISDIKWSGFQPMHNLKFLKFFKHTNDIEPMLQPLSVCPSLPQNLRLLQWDAYPWTTLPHEFQPDSLVELSLRYSNLENLWEGKPDLRNLRRLDLMGSKSLIKLPDLSTANQLEELIIQGCTKLEQIPGSIGSLSSLWKLDLSHCDGLRNLNIHIAKSEAPQGGSPWIWQPIELGFHFKATTLKSLTSLSIEGNIWVHLAAMQGAADHLSFTSERQIPDELIVGIQSTPHLQSQFYGFRLLDIMRFNYHENGDRFRFDSFADFAGLTELSLVNLNINCIPTDIYHVQFLEKLDLSGNDFRELPSNIHCLTKLKYLGLRNCHKLETLPNLTQVETLALSNCVNLRSLLDLSAVDEELGTYRLLELGLDNCKNVQSLSDQLSRFTNLKELDLSRHDFETIPTSIKELSSMETLYLNDCKNLKSLEGRPPTLKNFSAKGCDSLGSVSLPSEHPSERVDPGHCCRLNQDAQTITQSPTNEEIEEASPEFASATGSVVSRFSCFTPTGTTSPRTRRQPLRHSFKRMISCLQMKTPDSVKQMVTTLCRKVFKKQEQK